jgi:hypothetical protein
MLTVTFPAYRMAESVPNVAVLGLVAVPPTIRQPLRIPVVAAAVVEAALSTSFFFSPRMSAIFA